MRDTLTQLQWGRDRSVAEIAVVVVDGAATDRSRKSEVIRWVVRVVRHASMGPRPIGRGNPPGARRDARSWGGASMGPRPIGRGNAAEGGNRTRHGLASMGPRPIGRGNCRGGIKAFSVGDVLQWGRDRSVAEMWGLREGRLLCDAASMGPR